MSELPWDYDNWRTRSDRDFPYDDAGDPPPDPEDEEPSEPK